MVKRLAFVLLTGCAQVLGLDDTKLNKVDAAIDAPDVCDGNPQCTSLNGRSVCGQIYQTGANAGLPLRVANPTGLVCGAGNMEGPCGFTVYGQPRAAFLASTTTGRKDGLVDDCGRYAVIDFDSTQSDVAIVLQGDATLTKRTASLLLGRPTIAGPGNTDPDVDVFAITKATTMEWAMQVSAGTPPDTNTGYLVRYLRQGRPLETVQVAKDGSSGLAAPMPAVIPWAAYFSDGAGFGAIDPALTDTQMFGAAFAVFGAGTFSLQGVITGGRCNIDGLNQVDNTLIYVAVPGC